MAKNLELKLKLDSFDEIKKILSDAGCGEVQILNQKDTYYVWEKGLLKLREVNGRFELIKYNRDEKSEERWSDYYVLNIENTFTEKFFSDILLTEAVVKKQRELIIYKNTRIHLDTVDKLGLFLELETVVKDETDLEPAKQEFAEVVALLKLNPGSQIKTSYRNLMLSL